MAEVTTPPIIGAAMRFMISEPDPVLHMIGNSPKRMAAMVIILGRMRCTAPSFTAAMRSSNVIHGASRHMVVVCLIEINEHDHAGLGINTGQGDQADGHRHAELVSAQIEQPERADEGKRHGKKHNSGSHK